MSGNEEYLSNENLLDIYNELSENNDESETTIPTNLNCVHNTHSSYQKYGIVLAKKWQHSIYLLEIMLRHEIDMTICLPNINREYYKEIFITTANCIEMHLRIKTKMETCFIILKLESC